jgi:hypothetical protein
MEAHMSEISITWGDAYAEWLAARAAVAKHAIDIHRSEQPLPEDVDEQMAKIDARVIAAEHRLITARVTLGWQLLEKFEALQAMILQSERDGSPADRRHLLMLASFHTDLMGYKFAGYDAGTGGNDASH